MNKFAKLGMPCRIGVELIALERGIGEHLGQGILDQRDVLVLGEVGIKLRGRQVVEHGAGKAGSRRGEQDDLGAPAACQVDHAFQVGDGLALRLLAQHVVAAQSDHHQLRLMFFRQGGQPHQGAGVFNDG